MSDKEDEKKYTSKLKPIGLMGAIEIIKVIDRYKDAIIKARENTDILMKMDHLSFEYKIDLHSKQYSLVETMNLLVDLYKTNTVSEQSMMFMFKEVQSKYQKHVS